MPKQKIYSGIPVSGGLAFGPLWPLQEAPLVIQRQAGSPQEEAQHLKKALHAAAQSLEKSLENADALTREIMEFQAALLEDVELLKTIFHQIELGVSAHEAWRIQLDQEIADYQKMEETYFAERSQDLVDLKQRVLHQFAAPTEVAIAPAGSILIAQNLTPSQFLETDWNHYAGAATCAGSPTSHVAILARARGVNLVVGLAANPNQLAGISCAILDAEKGQLICNPNAQRVEQIQERMEQLAQVQQEAQSVLHQPAKTAQGEAVQVMINLDDPALLEDFSPEICDGIGLTRTEFLFQQESLPNEETQWEVYLKILQWAGGKPVTIRTLDAGGDKPIPAITLEGESNPFLGMRGVRLSLVQESFFLDQLKALCRAATAGPLRVMVPMVTHPHEMQQVQRLFQKALQELDQAGVPHQRPKLGMMVEVPSAALLAAQFEVDFYSIGSNDLIQYTTASARDISQVAHLADPQNPAVLTLIKMTVEAAQARKKDVSLCGDMASSPELVALLLECGLRHFSCAPAQVGAVKRAIGQWPGVVQDKEPGFISKTK